MALTRVQHAGVETFDNASTATLIKKLSLAEKETQSMPGQSSADDQLRMELTRVGELIGIEKVKAVSTKNFLCSFVSTLSKKLVTDYLELRNYDPSHIYLINKGIHSLILLMSTGSLMRSIIQPAIKYLLTEHFGVREKHVNDLTRAMMLIVFAVTAFRHPQQIKKSALFLALGLGFNSLGHSLAEYAYGVTKNGMFSEAGANASADAEAQLADLAGDAADEEEKDELGEFEFLGHKGPLLL